MKSYIFTGTARELGRHGYVEQGDELELTDAEAAAADLSSVLVAKPEPVNRDELVVATDTQLDETHAGKLIKVNTASAAIEITLPADPDPGFTVEIAHAETAVEANAVTVDPGAIAIHDETAQSEIASVTVTGSGDDMTAVPAVSFDGDGAGGTATARMKAASGAVAAAGTGYVPAEVVQLAGGTFSTRAAVTVATAKAVSATVPTAGTGYVVGELITAAGGTSTVAAKFAVSHTKVVSAGIVAGGTGGTDGTQTVTGTTGTGTKFQASVTIAGGIITAVLSITVAGDYTVNPADIANEPVTGANLADAVLSVVMGVLSVTVDTAGSYTVLPSNPVAQASTDGAGTGAAFTVVWGAATVTASTAGNYSVLPSNAVAQQSTSGAGTGLTVNVTWGVLSVTVSAGGEYNDTPDVVFDGGTAVATAVMAQIAGDDLLTFGARKGYIFGGVKWHTF